MRTRRMMVKQALDIKCAEHRNCRGKVCRRYSMTELEVALSQMKNGAPGPDGVTPQMLKELSNKGKKILLRVLNHSLATGQVPTAWRRANRYSPDPKRRKTTGETLIGETLIVSTN